MNLFKTVILFILISMSLGFLIGLFISYIETPQMKSYDFCNSKGYDGASWGGFYSERFNKVECISCYKEQCDKKEFDVYKSWTGKLIEKAKSEDTKA